MKIVFLNAWRGQVGPAFVAFMRACARDTDIFCIQEADPPLPAQCGEILKGYERITAHKFVTEKDDFYLATYVRRDIEIESSRVLFEDEDEVGLGIYTCVAFEDSKLHLCNFHGMSRPVDKRDTPGRWRQAKGIIEFFASLDGPKIVGGDFNIFPTNKSLQLFQREGYADLIRDYGITNTRNHLVWDRYPEKQYYSDYAFVKDGVVVEAFTVPDVEVSDHQPLILEVLPQATGLPTPTHGLHAEKWTVG